MPASIRLVRCAASALCVVLTAFAARAENVIPVLTPSDTVGGALTSLRDAVAIASQDGEDSRIVLAQGVTYTLTLCAAGDESGPVNDSNDLDHTGSERLVIEGHDAVIRTVCVDRVLHTHGTGPLELEHVTVRDGRGVMEGGGVLAGGEVLLRAATIQDNTVTGPGWLYVLTSGGGLAAKGTVKLIESSVVERNHALHDPLAYYSLGGGIYSTGVVSLTAGSVVRDNTATGYGGGIYSLWLSVPGGATVSGNVVKHPLAPIGLGGGAFVVKEAAISGAFTGNAADFGGAIAAWTIGSPSASVTLTGGLFTANTATKWGGAIAFGFGNGSLQGPNVGDLTILRTRFENNSAQRGGAVYHVGWDGQVSVELAHFVGNVASGAGAQSTGGAMDVAATTTIEQSLFQANDATTGGALYLRDSDLLIYGGPTLGEIPPGSFAIETSRFLDNRASAGGAVAVGGNGGGTPIAATLASSRLTGNRASGGDGGALLVEAGASLTVTQTSVDSNVARRYGGGAALRAGSTLSVENASFLDNAAVVHGGGISNDGGTLALRHATLHRGASAAGSNLFSSGLVTSRASIVAHGGGAPNCLANGVASQGYNADTDASCGFAQLSDWKLLPGLQLVPAAAPFPVVQDVAVEPAPGSPVVNGIPLAACTLPADQFGVARPVGPGCEPGAIEIDGEGFAGGNGESVR